MGEPKVIMDTVYIYEHILLLFLPLSRVRVFLDCPFLLLLGKGNEKTTSTLFYSTVRT